MTTSHGGPPLGPDGLPDLSVYSSRREPRGASAGRLVAMGVALLLAAGGAAFGFGQVLGRVRSATAPLGALPSGLGGEGLEDAPRKELPISPEKLAELQKSWIGSETIAPRNDRVDPTSGERIGAFQGFGLLVDSAPAGARVVVNGEEMGTTPLLTTVACVPGDPVEVSLERGADGATATTRCRKDALVKLRLRLERPRRR
ncbi:MAG TPA: PEGA domain-containing protein [Anaeromyxobacteraceae bacterium]|nr:PEGA domain-containing protein [Anaeromyxobacteraceae bacterium]